MTKMETKVEMVMVMRKRLELKAKLQNCAKMETKVEMAMVMVIRKRLGSKAKLQNCVQILSLVVDTGCSYCYYCCCCYCCCCCCCSLSFLPYAEGVQRLIQGC